MKNYRNNLSKLIFLSISILLINCKKNDSKKVITLKSKVEHLPYYNDPLFTPNWLTPNSPDLNEFHKIRPFKLINQLGDTVTNNTFKGKIYVTNFFFTTCSGICPKMTENMTNLQELFKNDDQVLFLSHSVTPNFDTVEKLNQYGINKKIDPKKWHLVTGKRDSIYDLGRNFYFVEEDLGKEKSKDDFLHTENFLLIDENRHIRGIYNGIKKLSLKLLISDIETLKKEMN